jgi:hypothetical protein
LSARIAAVMVKTGFSARRYPTMRAELCVVQERYHAVMGVPAGAPGDREERLDTTQAWVWRNGIGW